MKMLKERLKVAYAAYKRGSLLPENNSPCIIQHDDSDGSFAECLFITNSRREVLSKMVAEKFSQPTPYTQWARLYNEISVNLYHPNELLYVSHVGSLWCLKHQLAQIGVIIDITKA